LADTGAVNRVAVVLFDGFTVLDVYGPVQAFGACRIARPDGPPDRFFMAVSAARNMEYVWHESPDDDPFA
jgi:hypothetical protein